MNARIQYYRSTVLGDSSKHMINNLKKYITLSGMSHAEVAEKKGLAPESLSRHISGRSNFNIQDAVEYAAILDIDPSALLFEDTRIKIYGTIDDGYHTEMVSSSEKERFVHCNMARFPSYFGAFLNKRDAFNAALDGTITWADMRPIQDESIPQDALSRCNIIKAGCGGIFQCVIHKQPDGKFTIQSFTGNSLQQDVKIIWACPVLGRAERPDLLGLEIK